MRRDFPPLQLRQFATLLYEQGKGGIVGAFSGNGDGGYSYALGSSRFDMRALSRRMNQELSGRGGGSPLMAQGTFQAPREAIETVFLREAGSSRNGKDDFMELDRDTIRKLRGLILYTVILVAAAINYRSILSVGRTALALSGPLYWEQPSPSS